jgi:hypothetical protein
MLRGVGAVDPLIIGDGARVYRATIRSALGDRVRLSAGAGFTSVAGQVALLSEDRLGRREGAELATLAPRYLRSSEAENKLASRL